METHTAEEIDRAVAVGARIIGVNVRNLKTLDVDRSCLRSLPDRIPAGAVVVAESGVRSVADVRDYASQGAGAMLVGEALVSDGRSGSDRCRIRRGRLRAIAARR